jgi:hypothetical protein
MIEHLRKIPCINRLSAGLAQIEMLGFILYR